MIYDLRIRLTPERRHIIDDKSEIVNPRRARAMRKARAARANGFATPAFTRRTQIRAARQNLTVEAGQCHADYSHGLLRLSEPLRDGLLYAPESV